MLYSILLYTFLCSCSILPLNTLSEEDIGLNPAKLNYFRMEFDISIKNSLEKQIGIADITLTDNVFLNEITIYVHGIYKGLLKVFSKACKLDFTVPYTGIHTFKLDELIQIPTTCSIQLVSSTNAFKNTEHTIIERGLINLFVLPQDKNALNITYSKTNSLGYLKRYAFSGQGSIQLREGNLSSAEGFYINTTSAKGFYLLHSTCSDKKITSTYNTQKVFIKYLDFFDKDSLTPKNSCGIYIIVIPEDETFSYMGRFYLNVFDKNVLRLEPLYYTVSSDKITVTKKPYIFFFSVNKNLYLKSTFTFDIKENIVYWIRSITKNGRKSVYALRNGFLYWSE